MTATLGSPQTGAYVQVDRPQHATYLRASFWIDPRNLQLAGGQNIRFMNLVDDSEGGIDPTTGVISVGYLAKMTDGQWKMTFWNLRDAGAGYGKAVEIVLGADAAFPMQMELRFWRGDASQTTFCAKRTAVPASEVCGAGFSMLDADVDAVRFGLFANSNPSNALGSYDFDELDADWQ